MNWFLLAFVAPILWAIVAILDTYFIHGVYEDEYDKTVVLGVFRSLSWILVPLGGGIVYRASEFRGCFGAFGRRIFPLSFFRYFKALFVANDTVLMQIYSKEKLILSPL